MNGQKTVKLQLTFEELQLVTSLISDQLFRKEFIDPKMPGYKGNPSELAMGKELVSRLRALTREVSDAAPGAGRRRAASHLTRNQNGATNAV